METNIPLNGKFEVTAAFGEINPKLWSKAPHKHKGIDLISKESKDSIYATCNGIVTVVGWDPEGWGRYISIQPDDNPSHRHIFAHLADGSQRVKKGDRVTRKTVIGVMGATGNVIGKHLHYEIRDDGVSIDPSEYMGIPNKRGVYNSWDYVLKTKYQVCITFETREAAEAFANVFKAAAIKESY